jgi:hypothetical protein
MNSPSRRDLFRTVLEIDDHTVIEPGDRRTASPCTANNARDLVITDIHLPESYGPEAIMI